MASQALASAEAYFNNIAQGMKESLSAPTVKKIRCDNKKFVAPSGEQSPVIRAVIIDYAFVNDLYPPYTPGQRNKPECSAISTLGSEAAIQRITINNEENITPYTESPKNDVCAGCPMNEWGSRGKGKACKNAVALALMNPEDESGEILVLEASRQSVKHFETLRKAINATGMPFMKLVVEISFDPNNKWDQMLFKIVGPHEKGSLVFSKIEEAGETLKALRS